MWKDFKNFISKGNVMDLAVGVIIGGAFQAIVTSLVNDIIMPCISIITGKVDLTSKVVKIGESVEISYGNFINSIINFLIIALVIFLLIRYITKLQEKNKKGLEKISAKLSNTGVVKKLKSKKKGDTTPEEEVEAEPETKLCPYCLSEVPYKATKCAHCTSDLPTEGNN